MSFNEYSFLLSSAPNFIGLQNFIEIFSDNVFLYSLRVTAFFTLLSVFAEVGLGLELALLLNRQFKGLSIVRTLAIVPMTMSSVAAGYLWRFMYWPRYGLLDTLLSFLGIGPLPVWLSDPGTALLSVILVDIWQWTPFTSLIFLVGLSAIPRERYEAAEIDGASTWQTFRYITLPLMTGVIAVAVLFRITDCIRYFDQVYVLTRGGPGYETYTTAFYIYRIALVGNFEIGYSSAMSWVLNFISLAVCLILIRTVLRPSR
jgi:multiple sugar transport system permease protein